MSNDNVNDTLLEPVLLVPPRLTQSAYATLVQTKCVPRRWHLEGRYGSRTHSCGDRMGLPVLSRAVPRIKEMILHSNDVEEPQYHYDDDDKQLRELLSTPGVELVYKTVFFPTNMPKEEPFDATIHPERKPLSCSTALDSSSKSSFSFLELFAGIGGFGVALEALGGTCVFSSELDAACRAVYEQNVSRKCHGDILSVSDDEIPSHDLLVAGFPCQPFSSLGTQCGIQDSRGELYLQIVRILKLRQPRAFLLENVPGLLQTNGGRDVEEILGSLEGAGYHVTTQVCNARCLTTQSRKRLFLVGLCKNSSQCHEFEFPYIPDLGLRAQDVMQYTEVDNDALHLSDAQMHQLATNKKWKPAHLAWPNVVCDTLDSHYGNALGKGNSQLVPCSAPLYPRCMTPRECARIMGFPNSFVLPTLPSQHHQGERAFRKQQYKMLGNAVCPPLVAALAGAILQCVFEDNEHWKEKGRSVAIELALNAVNPNRKEEIMKRLSKEGIM